MTKQIIIAMYGDNDGAYYSCGGITVEKYLHNEFKFVEDDECHNHYEANWDIPGDNPILESCFFETAFLDNMIIIQENDYKKAATALREYGLI